MNVEKNVSDSSSLNLDSNATISTNHTNTIISATLSNSSSHCLPFRNSDTWLNSPRFSNMEEEKLTHELVERLIMNVSPLHTDDGSMDVLNQTMCLNGSKFLNWESTMLKDQMGEEEEQKAIEYLSYRLIYLAIHENQHRFARKEAISRYNPDCNDSDENRLSPNNVTTNHNNRTTASDLLQANVGKFDFECPDAKYIVSSIPNIGFGAALRLAVPDPTFLGLMTNRVVLFLNSLPPETSAPDQAKRDLIEPLRLASCPRKDLQCIFMPLSPCTITHDDLTNASFLSEDDLKYFRKNGKLDEKYKNVKVLIMKPFINGHKPLPVGINDAFVNIISSLYSKQNPDNSNSRSSVPAPLIPPQWHLEEEVLQKVYKFIGTLQQWTLHVLTMFYILRPNMMARDKIDEVVQKVLPQNFNTMHKSAIGLPIRGMFKIIHAKNFEIDSHNLLDHTTLCIHILYCIYPFLIILFLLFFCA